jgi:hypothetical protein
LDRNNAIGPAMAAPDSEKSKAQDAAAQIGTKFMLNERGQLALVNTAFFEPRNWLTANCVFLDDGSVNVFIIDETARLRHR